MPQVEEPNEPVSRRDRPAKPPLSRRSIIEAAMALIGERGIEAATLRAVAERVQTGPASLYAYFSSREALLEHVLDAAYSQVTLAAGDADSWRRALAATIADTVETLQRYPGLGVVALGTIPTLPGAMGLAEHELMLMEAGGVSQDRAALAVDLIAQFVAATAVERRVRRDQQGAADHSPARKAYEEADPAHFPHVARSAAALTGPDEQARRDFAIGVIINGLTQAR